MVANEFNKLWDKFLTSQKELDEDLIKKNDEFENILKEIIENINQENMMKNKRYVRKID